ncbi:hypothetical protein GEV33_001433 [Tenebrio molitor]|uniref:Uncharacterized protein n=1 Tax=Tenebrio molitor TaxID=7067 RepID=A0A8J6HXL6_TENMO|nr:hypothetical protein GEV33_001433 [Tenebrio molitor]
MLYECPEGKQFFGITELKFFHKVCMWGRSSAKIPSRVARCSADRLFSHGNPEASVLGSLQLCEEQGRKISARPVLQLAQEADTPSH